ncbi:MAG TPA: PilZ domain-containing protein [Oscillatoriaceae cyanobacterium]
MLSPDTSKPNQVLRLTIERRTYSGLIVSMTEDTIMVATTLRERPDLPIGALVQAEMPKEDGLYVFTSRLVGLQMMPMMVLILDRPRSLRRMQRRKDPRFPVSLDAQLIYVSHDLSINTRAEVRNMSRGGIELWADVAAPVDYHCIVVLQPDEAPLNTICLVIYSEGREERYRMGLAFAEMSLEDRRRLDDFIAELSAS